MNAKIWAKTMDRNFLRGETKEASTDPIVISRPTLSGGDYVDLDGFIAVVIDSVNDLVIDGFNNMEEFVVQTLDLESEPDRRALKELWPVSDTGAAVGTLLRDLLESNTKFVGNVEGTIESQTQDMVLLLDSRAMQGRAIEQARERGCLSRGKRSTKYLSLAQHRKLGSYQLPQSFEKSNDAMMQSCLLTADLHGAILAVVDCKTPSYFGLQGIMIRETSKTFGLITSEDKFAVIPKEGSTFRLKMKNTVVTLFGSGLGLRGATSTTKA